MSKRQRIPTPVEDEREKRNGPITPWKRQRMAPRRAAAQARQVERIARGDEGQLRRLDEMFGAGAGAQRERARLAARIFNAKGGKLPKATGSVYEKAA